MAMVMCVLLGAFAPATAQEDMARGFTDPPNAAKPRVYWWWLMSLVSKEGITKDLEEMAAKGIGGVLIFDCAGVGVPMPAAPSFMSPGWRENFRHALREADRLGLEVSVNMCTGWDAGGPWITPDHASKHFQQSELIVTGPQKFSGKLPKPVGDTPAYREIAMGVGIRPAAPLSAQEENYREIAVQAVPRKAVPGRPRVRATASSAQPAHPVEKALDGVPQTIWVSGGYQPGDAPTREKPEWIRFEFDAPFTAGSLRLLSNEGYGPRSFDLQVSDGIAPFRTVKSFELARKGAEALDFPETTARVFRLLITSSYTEENIHVREVSLANMPPLIISVDPLLAIKSGRDSFPGFGEQGPIRPLVEAPLTEPQKDSGRFVVDPKKIIDLCDKVAPDGTLEWDVPPLDALKNLGRTDIPMGEFWQSEQWKENGQHIAGKQTASAAHIYGKTLAAAEAFTSSRPS